MTTPDALREAIARAREALTPYEETKIDYMGRFSWTEWLPDGDGIEQGHEHVVPWTTVKEIMRAFRERAGLDLLDESDCYVALTTTPLAGEVRPSGDMVKSAVHCLRDLAYQLEQWARLAAITPRQRKRVVEIADEADRRARDLLSGTGEAPTPSNIGDAEAREALEEACALIQEAKGLADGPDGGAVTDHLDFAESWIDKALAALAKLSGAGDGWHDIASAPEGEDILVCVTHSLGDGEWETVQWVDWQRAPVFWPIFRDRIDIPFPPTHWRPLSVAPNPPKATCTPPVGEGK